MKIAEGGDGPHAAPPFGEGVRVGPWWRRDLAGPGLSLAARGGHEPVGGRLQHVGTVVEDPRKGGIVAAGTREDAGNEIGVSSAMPDIRVEGRDGLVLGGELPEAGRLVLSAAHGGVRRPIPVGAREDGAEDPQRVVTILRVGLGG